MARRGRKPKQKVVYKRPTNRLQNLWQTRQNALIIGTLVVSAIVLYAIAYFVTKHNSYPYNNPAAPVAPTAPSAPKPGQTKPTATPTPTPRVSGTESGIAPSTIPTNAPSGNSTIKKLPFTATEPFDYTMQNGDTLYQLGLTFCHDKGAYVYLSDINHLDESSHLHPGDVITISCP